MTGAEHVTGKGEKCANAGDRVEGWPGGGVACDPGDRVGGWPLGGVASTRETDWRAVPWGELIPGGDMEYSRWFQPPVWRLDI